MEAYRFLEVSFGTLKSITGNASWGDQLTKYNGTTITYDAIGNPLSYYNGLSYTFTWKNGRQLATVSGSANLSFQYNEEGIRTSKTASGVEHIYHLNGTQIVAEEWGNKLLIYLYDANGAPIGMQYRTTSYAEGVFDTYWFEKNLQGDIVAVYNDAGTLLVTYTYDAWGYLLSTKYYNSGSGTAVQYNPFRYRGYYRDSETGFYYLNSRYYDPNTGRFLNADVYVDTATGILSNNMYAYCNNNPIINHDHTGQKTFSIGWNFSAYIFSGISYSVNLSFDTYGNIAIQTSEANVFKKQGGVVIGFASVGFSRSISHTSLDTVYDLEGDSITTTYSKSSGCFSASKSTIMNSNLESVGKEVSTGIGLGTSIDLQATVSNTKTIFDFNYKKVINDAWDSFKNWLGW